MFLEARGRARGEPGNGLSLSRVRKAGIFTRDIMAAALSARSIASSGGSVDIVGIEDSKSHTSLRYIGYLYQVQTATCSRASKYIGRNREPDCNEASCK